MMDSAVRTLEFSDEQLLALINANDEKAFDKLYARYWKLLYTIAWNRLRDQTAAEDLVQELFINFWERRNTIVIKTFLENYLRASMKYMIIAHVERMKANTESLKRLLERMATVESGIHETLVGAELEKTISDAVSAFPENMQKVFRLRSEDLSVREIAAILGLAEQTVKNNISEALEKLRVVLAKQYPDTYQSFYTILAAVLVTNSS